MKNILELDNFFYNDSEKLNEMNVDYFGYQNELDHYREKSKYKLGDEVNLKPNAVDIF